MRVEAPIRKQNVTAELELKQDMPCELSQIGKILKYQLESNQMYRYHLFESMKKGTPITVFNDENNPNKFYIEEEAEMDGQEIVGGRMPIAVGYSVKLLSSKLFLLDCFISKLQLNNQPMFDNLANAITQQGHVPINDGGFVQPSSRPPFL